MKRKNMILAITTTIIAILLGILVDVALHTTSAISSLIYYLLIFFAVISIVLSIALFLFIKKSAKQEIRNEVNRVINSLKQIIDKNSEEKTKIKLPEQNNVKREVQEVVEEIQLFLGKKLRLRSSEVLLSIDEVLNILPIDPRAALHLLSKTIETQLKSEIGHYDINYAVKAHRWPREIVPAIPAIRSFLAVSNRVTRNDMIDESLVEELVSMGLWLLMLMLSKYDTDFYEW